MSQIYKPLTSGGPIPPVIPTSFVTDVNSPAIPAANILNVPGGTSSINNTNGLQTDGSSGSNTLTVQLTNRVQGSASTVDATPTTLSTFSLGATPGVYNFDIQVSGYDLTDNAGCGYFISGSVRTTGAAAVLVGTPDKIVNEEAGVTTACDANLIVSGNNAIVQVVGINAKNINWRALSQYIFVS